MFGKVQNARTYSHEISEKKKNKKSSLYEHFLP